MTAVGTFVAAFFILVGFWRLAVAISPNVTMPIGELRDCVPIARGR